MDRSNLLTARLTESAPETVPSLSPESIPVEVPDRTLEIPMRLLGRTVKQTRDALASLAPGQVLAVHTNDP